MLGRMAESLHPDMVMAGMARVNVHLVDGVIPKGKWNVICRDKHGRIKWRDTIDNLVTDAGEDEVLAATLKNAAQAAWYVMLTDGTPTVAEGDTAASHAGWVEVQTYSESVRETWNGGAVSGQSVDNSASKASFSINGTVTVGGAALISNNTKGGTSGILYSAGAFSGGDKSLANGDTLDVTATFTAGGA